MQRYLHAIFLSVLLLLSVSGRAQLQPRYYHYNTANGLQSNAVYHVHLARNGLVYMAHELGLSSFDGQNFIDFPNLSQPNCELTNIIETSSGRIFCKSFTNTLYELRQQQLHYVASYPTSIGFSPAGGYKQYIFNITADTLVTWNTATNTTNYKKLHYQALSPNGNIVFVGSYKANGTYYTFFVNEQLQISYADTLQYPMYLWHSSNGEVFGTLGRSVRGLLRLSTGERIQTPNGEDAAVNYVSCSDSNIWICTNNGVYYRKRHRNNQPLQHILAGYNTTAVAEIDGKSVVVSMVGGGIIHIPCFDVMQYPTVPATVTVINGTSDKLLLGCTDGSFVTIDKEKPAQQVVKKIGTQPLSFIFTDGEHIITESNGIVNGHTKMPSLKDYCKVQGGYVVSSFNGLFFYQQAGQSSWFMRLQSDYSAAGLRHIVGLNGYVSRVCYNPTNQALYLCADNKLYYWDSTMTAPVQFYEPRCVLRDIAVYNNELYMATKDLGLLVLRNQKFVPATTEGHSLTGSILYQIQTWENEMWLLGEDAITIFDGHQVQQFNRNIGINIPDVRAFHVDSSHVYVLEAGKITRFPKNILLSRKISPNFLLHSVYSDTQRVEQGQRLQANQNHIRFHYSFVSLGGSGNAAAAYSVNGGKKMLLPAKSNVLELNYLQPGNYQIDFYTVANNQYTHSAGFGFRIIPRFYNKPGFWILLLAVAAGLYYWYNIKRIARIRTGYEQQRARMMLERELDKSLLTSIRAQMNPHFLFNALNTIQSYVYMNDKRSAGIYISKFSDLTRRILDHSSRDTISLAEELNALNLYLELEAMRFEGILEYHIDIDAEVRMLT